MIIAFAFVEGFQQSISAKVFSFSGNIRVQQEDSGANTEELPADNTDSIRRIFSAQPNIRYADAIALKSAMLKTTESIEGVLLKGIEESFSKERLQPFLTKGSWINFHKNNGEQQILISEYTAKQLKADIGSKLLVYFVDDEGTQPRVRAVYVCGLFKTSIEEYDKQMAVVDIDLIRKLNGWKPGQIGGYEITINDYRKDRAISNQLLDQLPIQWFSTPIRDVYPNIFDWLQLQNTNKYVIMIIMCAVAIINLVSCLIILVLERRKMIGILKATGADNWQLQGIFWNQALVITFTGMLLGTLLALTFCWLQYKTGFITLQESAYYISKAPVKIIWWQVVLVNVITFLISFLILLIPSLLVRKISPVQTLRFE